jgi:DNA-binding CsgD family transcriptional regulator
MDRFEEAAPPFAAARATAACSDATPADEAWLGRLAASLAPLSPGLGAAALAVDDDDPAPRALVRTRAFPFGDEETLATYASVRSARGPDPAVQFTSFPVLLEGGPIAAVVVSARVEGRAVAVLIPRRPGRRVAPRVHRRLRLLAGHLGTAVRLRRTLGAVPSPERAASGTLAEACRAAGICRPSDGDPRVAWDGLWSGRWSVVATGRRGGAAVLLLRRCPPEGRDLLALTSRERQVLASILDGASNKAAAWELGLAPSTVAGHLRSALARLGLRSRGEAITLFAPARLRPEALEAPPPGPGGGCPLDPR